LIGDNEVIYSNPQKVINRAKNNIPDINVKIIPKAGHAIFYDRPDIIGKEIIEFLK
jgi:pimeloyl-ACP methyl ester carboxylesterase